MLKFKSQSKKDIEKSILEDIDEPIVAVSFDKKILYKNNAAKELEILIGKKNFIDLVLFPVELDKIKKNSSVKGLFRKIGKNQFLIDVSLFQDEGVILLIKDITRFSELENQAKKEGILVAVFKYLSQIFHDMKGPIGGIKGSAQLLKEDPEDTELIDDILYETKRLENLITEITTITKPLQLNKRYENIHTLLDEALNIYKKQYPDVEIKRRYDPSLPEIKIDKEQILKVFINLIRNAFEAIEGKGNITIETGISWDKVYSPRGNKVFIRIKDSGKGVPEDMIDKLFIPFVTTKKNGMGVGLSSSFKIVKEHNGILRYIGNSTFEIILPIK